MNILVLMPRFRRLEYAFFGDGDRKALLELHRAISRLKKSAS